MVKSSRRAGVTRSLRWVRVGQKLDLLDAPGVLPTRIENQDAALKLALCDDIGQAAYDVESVAIEFLGILSQIKNIAAAGISPQILSHRYGIDLMENQTNAYFWLENAANHHTSGDMNRMAQRLLDDFRKNLIGPISLELP